MAIIIFLAVLQVIALSILADGQGLFSVNFRSVQLR